DRMLLGLGDQPGADPAATQLALDPQQVDEQPAGIAIADQAGADLVAVVADEDAEIRVARIPQERRVVRAEPVIDDFAVGPGRIVLETEPKSGRQVHANSREPSKPAVLSSLDTPVRGRQEGMHREAETELIRRIYAKQVMAAAGAVDR